VPLTFYWRSLLLKVSVQVAWPVKVVYHGTCVGVTQYTYLEHAICVTTCTENLYSFGESSSHLISGSFPRRPRAELLSLSPYSATSGNLARKLALANLANCVTWIMQEVREWEREWERERERRHYSGELPGTRREKWFTKLLADFS
jgi:hypothetical protein